MFLIHPVVHYWPTVCLQDNKNNMTIHLGFPTFRTGPSTENNVYEHPISKPISEIIYIMIPDMQWP